MRPDGSEISRIPGTSRVLDFDWSPDGERLVLSRFVDGADLWIIGRDGSDRVRITEGMDAHFPTWSPDGALIAFSGCCDPAGLFVVKPDGTELRHVLDRGGEPDWQPRS